MEEKDDESQPIHTHTHKHTYRGNGQKVISKNMHVLCIRPFVRCRMRERGTALHSRRSVEERVRGRANRISYEAGCCYNYGYEMLYNDGLQARARA